eukprot:CAMPEP_0176397218 /NCGR_PEP_ID=MMETSP0126-20121128/44945_1 /TAXON_ID=141414 ORGANISM="Strombidinopsis acuminatum, Strain SPMC142" /NCGR_SAMPLE_ID=MMETSP0126 /ASSEMBLY_ACC=CAM_ASM_000229 /LENGTH=102 /DNA_ID=CAMNT_0017771389 /DNA_START=14 /DNA_END=322 /DNA_ORIENTATION=+
MQKSSVDAHSSAQVTNHGNSYTATLKGKINGLEENVKALSEELNFYKKEIQNLRSEKETLDDVLQRKTSDIRKSLTTDVIKAEEDMKRSYVNQKSENTKIQN